MLLLLPSSLLRLYARLDGAGPQVVVRVKSAGPLRATCGRLGDLRRLCSGRRCAWYSAGDVHGSCLRRGLELQHSVGSERDICRLGLRQCWRLQCWFYCVERWIVNGRGKVEIGGEVELEEGLERDTVDVHDWNWLVGGQLVGIEQVWVFRISQPAVGLPPWRRLTCASAVPSRPQFLLLSRPSSPSSRLTKQSPRTSTAAKTTVTFSF